VSAPVRAPELVELETLVVCAAEGSLVAAAERLGISRPAVAKRMAHLEALAGGALLERGSRGVRLTDAGAELITAARRLLAERDALVGVLTGMRGHGRSPIAGVREMLGQTSALERAGARSETRLAETERVLELTLAASATGVVISDLETSAVYEVNDAFCRFTGHEREELLGRTSRQLDMWSDIADRDRVLERVARDGVAAPVIVHARRRDGTVRVGRAAVRIVELAGAKRLLTTVDDVTEEHRLDAERTAVVGAYRAVTAHATRLLAGSTVSDSLQEVLGPLREGADLRSAVLLDGEQVLAFDGEPPAADLPRRVARARPLADATGVSRSGRTGLVALPPGTAFALVLITRVPLGPAAESLFACVLADLVAVSVAARD
jgi:PAS domain S-box-containing protein